MISELRGGILVKTNVKEHNYLVSDIFDRYDIFRFLLFAFETS